MEISFDYFNQYQIPNLTLCNPNSEELLSLGTAYRRVLTLRYNALSEFSFVMANKIDTDVYVEGYDLIQAKRLVLIENIGYFRIDKVTEDIDGIKKIKNVTCFALEVEMVQKKLTAFGGTFKLYDITSPSTTLLGRIIQLIPNWTIGTIDSTLLDKFRSFDVSDTTIYNFLMTDVETAYGCIFVFDTVARTISALSRENATYDSDIYLSDNNIIKTLGITEISDEITTVLYVYGSGNLDIRNVNPLGTDAIYNFDYYMTTDWMSQSLIDAIVAWQGLVDTNQPIYATNLTSLKNYNAIKLQLNSELVQLNSELTTLETLEKVRIENNETFEDIAILITAKELEVISKQSEISVANSNITNTTTLLTNINSLLSFSSNFTPSQLLELNTFMIENTYQNENFIQTSIMTNEEIQDTAQDLYDQAVSVLVRLSQPRYEFSLDAANFVFLKEYEIFTNQLRLGSSVIIEKEEDVLIETILLEIKINYDDASDFSMTFSNRLRLDGASYIYSDLFGQTVKSATSVSFDSVNWGEWTNNYQDPVSTFITSSLNTSLNSLINADNQEIVINANGLKGKTYIPETQTYSPEQVWLTSNVLAFTDDAWQTAKAALGKVTINGSTTYGLVAGAVFGTLLAGNQLTITNETNNFTLDTTGATLNNAKFNLNDAEDKVTITISPIASIVRGQNLDPGFTIQSNVLGSWKKTFYVDSSGNAVFAGNLAGASGSFSGDITAKSGTFGGIGVSTAIPYPGSGSGIYKVSDPANYYIKSNGDLKWGALTINSSTATFSGNISATKLLGQVDWIQIVNTPLPKEQFSTSPTAGYSANGINNGSMLGNRISGGTINNADLSWGLGAVRIYSPGGGQGVISGTSSVRLEGGGGATVVVSSSNISLGASNVYFTGAVLQIGSANSVQTGSGVGVTGTLTVSTPSGNKILRFSKGLCYGLS